MNNGRRKRMRLFVKDDDTSRFIEELYKFMQEKFEDDILKMIPYENHVFISHENFGTFIDKEFHWDNLHEEFGIVVNIEVEFEVYHKVKVYDRALNDIAEILNWLIEKNKEDFLLFDDQTVPFIYRRGGEVIIKEDYMYFPLDKIKV